MLDLPPLTCLSSFGVPTLLDTVLAYSGHRSRSGHHPRRLADKSEAVGTAAKGQKGARKTVCVFVFFPCVIYLLRMLVFVMLRVSFCERVHAYACEITLETYFSAQIVSSSLLQISW